MFRLPPFLRLGRPLFLAGGIVLHGLGVVMALYQGATLNLAALFLGQAAVTAIQLMTHYSNEYFDLAADRANTLPTRWAGGSRVLVEGLVAPRTALLTAVTLAGLALIPIFLLPAVAGTGRWTIPLLLLALLLAWGYSAPPLRLHSRQLGELTAALLIPGLTPLVGYYLQAGRFDLLPFLAVWPLCGLQFAMILAINFPDAAGDAAAGKRTLVVVYGPDRAITLYGAAILLPYLSLPLLLLAGLPLLAAAGLLLLAPIAAWQWRRMRRRPDDRRQTWDSIGFWSIGLVMGTAVLELLAFGWLWLAQ